MAPRLTPVFWRELVIRLKKFGFEGPYQGGKHPYMVKGDLVLTIPNRHYKQIGIELLVRILRQAAVKKEEWLELG